MPPEVPPDTPSSLEEARKRLYSTREFVTKARSQIQDSGITKVPHAWGQRLAPKSHPHVRLALVFFVGAGVFFVAAGAIAALLFLSGSTSVSTANITLAAQGPTTIAGGDTVPLSIAITNRNPVALQNTSLEVDFPPGTRSATDLTQSYPIYTEDLGTILPGESISRSVKAVIFGSSGQALTIPISLSYQSQGSNATFIKKQDYPLTITSAPLSISVDTLSETVSGQSFTISIEARSNASTPLNNVLLQATLPFGYSLTSSSLPIDGSVFHLGSLQPGASQVIKLTGVLNGSTNDTRAFHFAIGTGSSQTDTSLALTYMQQEADIKIAAPFLATTLSLNGDTSDSPVLSPGATENATITYQNTLTDSIANAAIVVQIAGAAIKPGSIGSSNGFYNSTAGTITFSRDTDPALGVLAPGASGIGSFTFSLLPGAVRDPSVTFSISISGNRVGQGNVPEQVTASKVVRAKVSSAIGFSVVSLHSSGTIGNSGPIPPRVGVPTTYTVQWTVADPGNSVTGTIVSATLPSYVTFTDVTNPAAAFQYDDASRTVTWRPGDLAPGSSASASFQVSLTPSLSQKGTQPSLTSTATFTGFDRYTQTQLTASSNEPTTDTTSDAGYTATNGTVQ